jgi:hypothetical protein
VDLAKLSREDLIVAGLGIFLVIDLLLLSWYSFNIEGFPITASATSSPYSTWGVLALLVDLAFLADLALDRFSGAQLPTIGDNRATTRAVLAAGTLAFMVIKFAAYPHSLAIGCWLGFAAAIAMFVLCLRVTAP